jgi:hypothetical protein
MTRTWPGRVCAGQHAVIDRPGFVGTLTAFPASRIGAYSEITGWTDKSNMQSPSTPGSMSIRSWCAILLPLAQALRYGTGRRRRREQPRGFPPGDLPPGTCGRGASRRGTCRRGLAAGDLPPGGFPPGLAAAGHIGALRAAPGTARRRAARSAGRARSGQTRPLPGRPRAVLALPMTRFARVRTSPLRANTNTNRVITG